MPFTNDKIPALTVGLLAVLLGIACFFVVSPLAAVTLITALIVTTLSITFRRSHQKGRRAGWELREQESQLRAVLQGALDAVVTMDRDGLVVEWNPQAEAVFGYSRQEAIGQRLSDMIIPHQYRDAHSKGMQRFLSTDEVKILRKRIEITALRKNGEEFPVELTVIPIHAGGQVLFSSFIRDITERKQVEKKLRESTAFIESLFEHIPNMVFVKDARDLRFVRFNKAGEELLGLSRSELLGKNDCDLFPEEEADFFTAKDRETLSNNRLTDIPEERIQTKSKGMRILHTKKIPITDSTGAPQYLLGISEDITEHRQAIQDLKVSEERFQLAVRGSSDGIWDWNIATDEVYYSPRFKELLGYEDHEFPHSLSTFWSLLHPNDRKWVEGAIQAHLTSKVVFDVECRLRLRSGEYKWIRARGQALWSESGQPGRMAGSITDITKAKEAESAIIQSRLELLVAGRAKSEFLANMSHEMRTPLNAIVGITDFLVRSPLSPEQRSLVQRCSKASDGLLRLIDDLLLAAKVESGTLGLVEEPFGLRDVVTECTGLMLTEAQTKNLALTVHLDAALPAQVVGDAQRLRQILLNLIRNAIKFTKEGRIKIHVGQSPDDNEESHILVSVTDTGIGIAPEQRETIFNRFTQANSPANRQYGGVGLGLAICKQLVGLMGGRIWVESTPGKGSTFSFIVRFTAAPDHHALPRAAASAIPAQMDETHGYASRSLNILLAEDCIESQDIMKLYLRDTSHQLHCAETGVTALEQFKSGRFDLVFMDLHMPEMDGCSATRLIRAWEAERRRTPTPIVALTANGLDEARLESRAAGCDGFLTKPIRMTTLLQTIQRYSIGAQTAHGSLPRDDSDQSIADEIARLRPQFIQNRYRDVTALQAAIAESNFDTIRRVGHQIKGLAGSYGLYEIGTIGESIEQAALARNVETVIADVARLNNALHEAEQRSPSDFGQERHAA